MNLYGVAERFFDAILSIYSSLYVMTNVYFQELYPIENALNDMRKSNDHFIIETMGDNMKSKNNKYWGRTNVFNLMIYVSFILDP